MSRWLKGRSTTSNPPATNRGGFNSAHTMAEVYTNQSVVAGELEARSGDPILFSIFLPSFMYLTQLEAIGNAPRRFSALIARPSIVWQLDLKSNFRLKSLNDSYGHLAGADAVRIAGHLIAHCAPARAGACRYGGDEFVFALPDCRLEHAVEIAERLRFSVLNEQPVLATRTFPSGTLSISVGIASRFIEKDGDPLAAGEERVSPPTCQAN
jgi:diguanylate cyclase (GGDEF)-like protein